MTIMFEVMQKCLKESKRKLEDKQKLLKGNKKKYEGTQKYVKESKTILKECWHLRSIVVLILIAARQSGFIVPYVWKIVVTKNLTNFEGCHFGRFYILIWLSFPKIETKNFNSGSCFCKLVKLGTISPAAHFFNCVHIRRSQAIAAIVCGLSSGKRFVKLREVF